MNWSGIYLLCFSVGLFWSLATLLLGGMHLHLPKLGMHAHVHWQGHTHGHQVPRGGSQAPGTWGLLAAMINPSCIAVFLCWFGGAGYLLNRHSFLAFWVAITIAIVFGLAGALALASFLRYLQSKDEPMDPSDYEMTGVLGTVSSPIRPGGVGEFLFARDGGRRLAYARSEDNVEIPKGVEVIVTRFEKGIAYMKTWDAMTGNTNRGKASMAGTQD